MERRLSGFKKAPRKKVAERLYPVKNSPKTVYRHPVPRNSTRNSIVRFGGSRALSWRRSQGALCSPPPRRPPSRSALARERRVHAKRKQQQRQRGGLSSWYASHAPSLARPPRVAPPLVRLNLTLATQHPVRSTARSTRSNDIQRCVRHTCRRPLEHDGAVVSTSPLTAPPRPPSRFALSRVSLLLIDLPFFES